jgi:hypothetical protein
VNFQWSYIMKTLLIDLISTLCFPHLVPGAAGRNKVVHVPFIIHHSCEHISSNCEHILMSSSVVLNCNLH